MAATKEFIPRKYQRAAVKFMVSRPAAGLFLDPGLGKTACTYLCFDILRELGYVKSLLVVTLKRPAYRVWPKEIEKWGFKLTNTVLHGDGRRDLLKKVDVQIINYDSLGWLLREAKAHKLRWDMLALDESSMFRNPRSLRFKLIKQLMRLTKRRYILTGTPTPKSLMNLWAQIYALDGGHALGKLFTAFRSRYFEKDLSSPYPRYYPADAVAEKQIYRAVKDLVIRFDDSEVDMPKQVDRYHEIELPPKVRRIYDDMERDLFAMIGGSSTYAKNVGVATQKLRQIANGGLYIGEGDERRTKRLHDEKTETVLELLEELDGQATLVAFEFRHDRDRLLQALGKSTAYIDGTVNIKRSNEIEDAWNRGEIERLLVNPASVAFGLNLQETGRALIWHSLTWNYEHYDQLIRRIKRQGQKAKRIFVHHVVAKDTVDEAIIRSMSAKAMTQNSLFKALKSYMYRRKL